MVPRLPRQGWWEQGCRTPASGRRRLWLVPLFLGAPGMQARTRLSLLGRVVDWGGVITEWMVVSPEGETGRGEGSFLVKEAHCQGLT